MAITRDDTHMHVPRVTYQKFHALLPGSLQPDSRFFYDTCVRYNVDPLFVLAMFNHESSMGQEGWATRTYSWGNTRVPNFGPTPRGYYQQDTGKFTPWHPNGPYPPRVLVAFFGWRDGLESTVARLTRPDYPQACPYALRTIGEIFQHECGAVWAPAGDENNPAGYLNSVLQFMNTHQDIGGARVGNPTAKLTTYQGFLDSDMPNNPNKLMWGGLPQWISIHEVGNLSPNATGQMHYNFVMDGGGEHEVSFHAVVDEFATWQMMPWNAVAWHAGDGSGGPGNNTSIAIETVQIGNWEETLRKLAKLVADLRREFGLPLSKVVQHNKWSGKNCPEYLRAGRHPTTKRVSVNWNGFLHMVETEFQGGTDVDFPTEQVTQRINSRGEMELIINYGGQWTEVDGNVVVDAGVTGFNKDGVKYGRSYQAANGGFQNFNILGKKGE